MKKLAIAILMQIVTVCAFASGVTSPSLNNALGAGLVGYKRPDTGAVLRTLADKEGERVSVRDFGAKCDGVTNDTTALQAAINYAVSLQASGYGGGSGGAVLEFPPGSCLETGLTLAPASGVMSVSLRGSGRGSTLVYTGAGGTALTIKNNNNFSVEDLRIVNAGSGTTTGLTLQSVSSGSSSTGAQLKNLYVDKFTTGLHIGSSTDNAASEIMVIGGWFGSNGTTAADAVLIEGSATVTNSVQVTFVGAGVFGAVNGFRYAGMTNSSALALTFVATEAGHCTTDFQFDSPAHVVIQNHITEGSTAGWKLFGTATGAVASVPAYVDIQNIINRQSGSANSIAAWPGSYNLSNVDLQGVGITAGTASTGDRWQFDIRGRKVPISYAAGAHSIVYVHQSPANNSSANNQSIGDGEDYFYDTSGVKHTLMSFAYSPYPVVNGLSFGMQSAEKRTAPTYGASVAIDASLGNQFDIVATNGTAFTVAAPTNAMDGQVIRIQIKNTSGGVLGTVTWAAGYKLAAWTNPANGNSRSISFRYNGTNWVELSRTTADVPN